MADPDRHPTPSRGPQRPRDPDGSPSAPTRALTQRWWWQAMVLAVAGAAVIGFQWEILTSGEAIIGTWVMVAAGAGFVVAGAVLAWRSRPGRSGDGGD